MRLKKFCTAPSKTKKDGSPCNRQLIIEKSYKLKDGTLNTYRCGHIFFKPDAEKVATFDICSIDGKKKAFDYQIEGVQFIIDNDCNGLIADQMGLGKTIQALLAIKAEPAKMLPCLCVVKSATLWQWMKEYKTWTDPLPNGVWMIRNGKDWIPPGFSMYLISMDTLAKFVTNTEKEKKSLGEKQGGYTHTKISQGYKVKKDLKDIGFKSIIGDEVHSFKNTDSKRSIALLEIIKGLNIEHKIFLSGTPIKNRADEYFVPLNILDPENFPSMEHFRRRFLMQDQKGKWSRINPYVYDNFKQTISEYVIRRERNEVLKDLPPFRRVFTDIHIENENLIALYNKELEALEKKQGEKENLTYFDIQDNLMALRRLVGVAKAEFVNQWVEMFLEDTEDEKIAIGVHHHAVRDLLRSKLIAYAPLTLSGEDSADEKNRKVMEFEKPFRRIMIVNMLAGGVGLNLQFCNNALIVERQWSSADEEQFEDRFNRPGQSLPVTAEYFIAKGTVDEWFANLVEYKRSIFGETIANQWDFTSDANAIKDMVDWAVVNKLKK